AVGDGVASGGPDLVDHLAGWPRAASGPVELAAQVVDDDLRTLARQLEGVGSAEAPPGACDDGDAAFADPAHGASMPGSDAVSDPHEAPFDDPVRRAVLDRYSVVPGDFLGRGGEANVF